MIQPGLASQLGGQVYYCSLLDMNILAINHLLTVFYNQILSLRISTGRRDNFSPFNLRTNGDSSSRLLLALSEMMATPNPL